MTGLIAEPEFCPDCSDGTSIVDDHEEEDLDHHTYRVLDLACGHSLTWRR